MQCTCLACTFSNLCSFRTFWFKGGREGILLCFELRITHPTLRFPTLFKQPSPMPMSTGTPNDSPTALVFKESSEFFPHVSASAVVMHSILFCEFSRLIFGVFLFWFGECVTAYDMLRFSKRNNHCSFSTNRCALSMMWTG